MEEIVFLIEESPEGGLIAKALGHSIFSEAATYEEIKISIKEAVNCHFEDEAKRLIRLHYVRDEVIAA